MSAHKRDPLPTPTVEEMARLSGAHRPPWIHEGSSTYPPDCLGCGCRYIDHGEPGLACPEFTGGFSRVHKYRDMPITAAANPQEDETDA